MIITLIFFHSAMRPKETSTKEDDEGGRWHLKNAIRPTLLETESDNDITDDRYRGRAFHPQCYQDRNKATLNDTSLSADLPKDEQVTTTNLEDQNLDIAPVKSEKDLSDKEVSDSVKCETNNDFIDGQADEAKTSIKMEISESEALQMDICTENSTMVEAPDVGSSEATNEVEATTSPASDEVAAVDTSSLLQHNDVEDTELGKKVMDEVELNDNVIIEATDEKMEEVKVESSLNDETNNQIEKLDKDEKSNENDHINKSMDGNTLMTAPNSSAMGSNPTMGIRINILPKIHPQEPKPQLERLESTRSVSESEEGEGEIGSEFDPDAVIQHADPEQVDMKPKLKGRKMAEMPMQRKGGDVSSLCSIM